MDPPLLNGHLRIQALRLRATQCQQPELFGSESVRGRALPIRHARHRRFLHRLCGAAHGKRQKGGADARRLYGRGHVAALGPELPVAEPALHVRVPVEYHQRALPLQVAHHARYAALRRYRQQHVDVVGHQAPLDGLYPLVLAELPEDLTKVGPYLAADGFAPMLWRERDVALARPLRVRQAVGLLGHTPPPPSRLGFLAA